MNKHDVEIMKPVEPMKNGKKNVPSILPISTLPPGPSHPLDLDRVRQLASEHREELVRLAENDGPVVESENATHR